MSNTTGKYPGLMDLDNTKRSAFVACPRKYYWAYVRNIRSVNGSAAIRYGVAWHAMMEMMYGLMVEAGKWVDPMPNLTKILEAGIAAYDKESLGLSFADTYRTKATLAKAFLVYMTTFSNDPMMVRPVATEQVFEILMEPQTDEEKRCFAALKPFVFTGKLDMQILLDGLSWITEHKTTGAYMAQAKSRLHRSAQMMGYTWASKQVGIKTQGLLTAIHHISARKLKDGSWGEPKIEFERVPQMYTDFDLADWRRSFLDTAMRIQAEQERQLWPMCHDNCYQYGTCSYACLCEQDGRPLEDRILSGFTEYKWDVRNESAADE